MNRAHDVAALAVAVGVALLTACDDGHEAPLPEPCDRIGHPDFTAPGQGVIGPEGGIVEGIEELAGVTVEVPAGAWDGCWEVRIRYEGIFDAPDYPEGFVPFERPAPTGAVEIEIGLTDSHGEFVPASEPMPFTLSFPMDIVAVVTAGPEDIPAAFFTDEAHAAWNIELPRSHDTERLTVETSSQGALWSWGVVDLEDVDFDQHMRPALDRYAGGDSLFEVEAALADLARQVEEQSWALDCIGLGLAEDFFLGIRNGLHDALVVEANGLGCGVCDVTTAQFREQLLEWLRYRIMLELVDVIAGCNTGSAVGCVVVSLGLEVLSAMITEVLSATLGHDCNYACLFDEAEPTLWASLALYWLSDAAYGAVVLYGVIVMEPDCP